MSIFSLFAFSANDVAGFAVGFTKQHSSQSWRREEIVKLCPPGWTRRLVRPVHAVERTVADFVPGDDLRPAGDVALEVGLRPGGA